jgi:iron complex outermembrane receptor protein
LTLRRLFLLGSALLLAAATSAVAATGRIEGVVLRPDGSAVGGVLVTLEGVSNVEVSDAAGGYVHGRVPSGEHQVFLTLGSNLAIETAMVPEGGSVELRTVVDWDLSFAETITVQAASRRLERVVEAPAAVSILTPEEIERQSSHGQVPLLVGATSGAELAQGGLYDFNLNTRGFGGTTTRRVLTLIDGRDPSQPVFSGAQEWAAVSFPVDEIEKVEFVRGPGAALYGAGAYNGVLNLTTRSARDHGGKLRLTGGDLDTTRLDGRFATALSERASMKVTGFLQETDDFTVSRVDAGEYDGLPREAIAPPFDTVDIHGFGLRLDHDPAGGRLLTVDLGTASLDGTTVVTGLGRLQRSSVDRPWARVGLYAPRWNVIASHTGRDSDAEIDLGTGGEFYLDSYRAALEAQVHGGFLGGKGRLVGGVSYVELRTDSSNPDGVQTLFTETARSQHHAAFGQVEVDLGERLKAVLSARWDGSDIHDDEISPRGALVFAVAPHHTLRMTYGRAFQSASLSEKFLETAVLPPLDLSPIEKLLAPLTGGISLGLDRIPVLAVGSEDLGIERTTSAEIGYSGILGKNVFLNVSVYDNTLEDFRTNLVPVVGTSLGRLGNFADYSPAGLPAEVAGEIAAALRQALGPSLLLAQTADGAPFIPLLSFGTFGEVDTTGLEIDLETRFRRWSVDASYSHFNYDIRREAPENPLAPNRGTSQLSLGAAFQAERFDAGISYRWSDAFDYISGIFVGRVPSFGVVEGHLSYELRENLTLGLNVTNLLDDEHYEVFGGDILQRRALGSVTYSW